MSNKRELLDEILGMLRSVMDDREKLEMIREFFVEEIYNEPAGENIEYEVEIPEKYRKIVPEIAESIDAGEVCFLNTDTLETEEIPEFLLEEIYDEMDEEGKEWTGDFEIRHLKWENYIEITPPGSREAFRYMEDFAEALPPGSFKRKVIDALEKKRPFAHFKDLVEGSEYSQNWFDYKQKRLEEYVLEFLPVEDDEDRELD